MRSVAGHGMRKDRDLTALSFPVEKFLSGDPAQLRHLRFVVSGGASGARPSVDSYCHSLCKAHTEHFAHLLAGLVNVLVARFAAEFCGRSSIPAVCGLARIQISYRSRRRWA